ncbi:hypothetical protein EWB00_000662 [Schistosoma japonicum]|uniref:Uncharacterized protein n=1 Tax=Schistosoma japonicum TaxID=6182 RepID=A0A4Z2DI90_SCHJA|nr:hypothetical protein EWB00_000662 [Schistosoma japonicum]
MIIVLLLLCIPVLTVAKLDTIKFQVDVKLLAMRFLTDNKSTRASYVICNANTCNRFIKLCIRSTSQSRCTRFIRYTTRNINMDKRQISLSSASHKKKLSGFHLIVYIPKEELMDAKYIDALVFRKRSKGPKIDLLRYTLSPKEFVLQSGESTEWKNVILISEKKVLRLKIAFKVTYQSVDSEKYDDKQQKNTVTNNTLTTDEEVDNTMETNSNKEESFDIQDDDNEQGDDTDTGDKLMNDEELIDSIVTNSTNQGNDNNSGSNDQQHKTNDTHDAMTTESEIHDSTITQPTNQGNDNNSDSDDQQPKTNDTHDAMTTESEIHNSTITQPTNQGNDNNSGSNDQQHKTNDTHVAMTTESEIHNSTITQPTNQGNDSIPFWVWFICYLSKTIFRYDICPTIGYRSI